MISCDSIIPPAKAASIGFSDSIADTRAGEPISSSSPKPIIASPKAVAKGSDPLAITTSFEGAIDFSIRVGLALIAIRRSFAKGPNSTVPLPASVL